MLEWFYQKSNGALASQAFRCEGYVRDSVISNGQDDIPMEALPAFLRTLIVTDGTVTKTLEAFYWEPVAVDILAQDLTEAEHSIDWLEVKKTEDVLTRKVQLRGEHSGKIYASAFSAIRPSAIPPQQLQRLKERSIGIGALIRDTGLESYRELLEVGIEKSPEYMQTDNPQPLDLVYRTYRIFIVGKPALLITEFFPLDLYQSCVGG